MKEAHNRVNVCLQRCINEAYRHKKRHIKRHIKESRTHVYVSRDVYTRRRKETHKTDTQKRHMKETYERDI